MPFCDQPFYRIEVNHEGEVCTCCPAFISPIGNIYESPFEEIWNGEKVKVIRQNLLNGDFSMCNDSCYRKNNEDIPSRLEWNSDTVLNYPEEIAISSDNRCNVRCRICRDDWFHTDYNKDTMEEDIEKVWLPMFKDAKILHFGIDGDPFASPRELMIIKKAAEKYPNIKFKFLTNGLIASKKVLENLNIYNRIDSINVSIHSATWWTYRKIVRGGNWHRLLSNLENFAEMKKQNLINDFRFIFVVFSENYKEMPKFVKFAQKYNAEVTFWALRRVYKDTEMERNFDKYSLINPNHKHHKDLIKILKQPIFDPPHVTLFPDLKELRDKAL